MGLGGGPSEWADLEWVNLPALPTARVRGPRYRCRASRETGRADALAQRAVRLAGTQRAVGVRRRQRACCSLTWTTCAPIRGGGGPGWPRS